MKLQYLCFHEKTICRSMSRPQHLAMDLTLSLCTEPLHCKIIWNWGNSNDNWFMDNKMLIVMRKLCLRYRLAKRFTLVQPHYSILMVIYQYVCNHQNTTLLLVGPQVTLEWLIHLIYCWYGYIFLSCKKLTTLSPYNKQCRFELNPFLSLLKEIPAECFGFNKIVCH